MNTYIATTQEAARLHSGEQTDIVTMVKPQKIITDATIGYTAFTPKGSVSIRGMHKSGEYGESFFKLPYTTSQRIYVREAWQHTDCLNINIEDENSGYIYKASENGQAFQDHIEGWSWRSPVTMPRSAVRTVPIAGETVCCRVQDVLRNLPAWLEGKDGVEQGQAWYRYITAKFGKSAWDDNKFIFITKITKS